MATATRGRRRLVLLLAVMGPGLITGLADTDAQGVSTYSVLGARTGYRLLWGLVLTLVLLYVTQEMGARIGVATGRGLAELIRERFGVRVVTLAMTVMIVANLGTVLADFAGVAAALELLHPGAQYIGVPVVALIVYTLVAWGSYRRVERTFLLVGLFFLAYVVSAVLAKPDWGEAARGTLVPHLPMSAALIVPFVAAVGTTVTVWGQFFIQASVVEKGLTKRELGFMRIDIGSAALLAAGLGWLIAVTCAATLHARGLGIDDAADAARALGPLTNSGQLAETIFAAGLLMAGVLGVAVVSLATAYTACEGFGWESGLNRTPAQAPQFYRLFRVPLAVTALVVLAPRLPLIDVMVLSNLAGVLLLPVILILVMRLANDRSIMGDAVNSPARKGVGWCVTAVIIALDIALLAMTVFRVG